MAKLSATQQKVLDDIKISIMLCKKTASVKEYYIRVETDNCKGRPDYEEIVQREAEKFDKNFEDFSRIYGEFWKKGREENIALTSCSSSTLIALEKRGYIEIIKDGKRNVDIVKLLKEVE